eukprot:gnl/TRDRNA2_/TRDRNA2_173104_c2_seq2.p1 gnl/TRDRNA2_/TRDRNA2_173104_c2~~gnl/TRDRNA2_/TRDRNA2_173104_c2_seq2.p1  ORF type:complete len:499 (-),score=94.72 gnl/TRDRNA2_/TRDRNA2_173104_c2_seq2:53-1363(-)
MKPSRLAQWDVGAGTGLSALHSAYGELLAAHELLAEDHEVLCHCLISTGLVTRSELNSVRRARFLADVIREALQAPELAGHVGAAAGLRAACEFAAVSRQHSESMRNILPTLARQLPPPCYVCGGSASNTEVATVERFAPCGWCEASMACPDSSPSDAERGSAPNGEGEVEESLAHGGSWEALPPMPTARRWCAAAAFAGMLYVFGGHDGIRYLSSAERLNLVSGEWETLPPMPTAREGCAAVAAQGMLHVFGGSHGDHALDTVERLHPSAGGWWESLMPMPMARDACAAASDGGQVYLFGGRNSGAFLALAERFDPLSGSWEELAPMPTARLGCAAAAAKGSLYVFGGHGDGRALAVVERFSKDTGQWESLSAMPTARVGCAATSSGGRLYVFGGHDGGQVLGASESFDPVTGQWRRLPVVPTPRYACTGAAVTC